MSAILSADDLNDFISPGVACIKPVETLPPTTQSHQDPYQVTTEDKVATDNPTPAQISLTDCLACSGCVTSAEAVLVSLQSHSEVLEVLDTRPAIPPERLRPGSEHGPIDGGEERREDAKIFVASVSPQARASLAASYGITEKDAGYMIGQLLSGPHGLRSGGRHGNGFTWVIDTNIARDVCLVLGADEVMESLPKLDGDGPPREADKNTDAPSQPKKPILTSSCPGWICYAEKTHPHILPHLSRLKSPQALLGTLLKTSLCKALDTPPSNIWHLAIMPCFDKKLEASRSELTDAAWTDDKTTPASATRDVDCVITTRELLLLASSRGIHLPSLPKRHPPHPPFPDPALAPFLFPRRSCRPHNADPNAGTSGGNLQHILRTFQAAHPGSELRATRGRNADVVEHTVERDGVTLLRTARYYGFRNIQNLVRRLKPARQTAMPGAARRVGSKATGAASTTDYAYVEVMACPGGCTNGGGQIRAADAAGTLPTGMAALPDGPAAQRAWLARVDEAYFSAAGDSEGEEDDAEMDDCEGDADVIDGISRTRVRRMLRHWSGTAGVPLERLVRTSYRAVESDVGKKSIGGGGGGGGEGVVELAGKVGGGW